jgi:hypothetical protein
MLGQFLGTTAVTNEIHVMQIKAAACIAWAAEIAC